MSEQDNTASNNRPAAPTPSGGSSKKQGKGALAPSPAPSAAAAASGTAATTDNAGAAALSAQAKAQKEKEKMDRKLQHQQQQQAQGGYQPGFRPNQKQPAAAAAVASTTAAAPTPTASSAKQSQPQQQQGQGQRQQQQGQQKQQQPQQPGQHKQHQQQLSSASVSVSKGSRLALFDHLPRKVLLPAMEAIEGNKNLHPATVKIGLFLRQGLIRDDDDRVATLLAAFCHIIEDYKTPPNKPLNLNLNKHISDQVEFLVNCRQLNMGMGNLIKYLRGAISRISSDTSEADAKASLIEKLHSFLEERILFSRQMITQICTGLIRDGDVILTFGSSPLLRQIFRSAAATKKFKLIIVDARPTNDGLQTLEALSPLVTCVYTTLAGAATAMADATKVLLVASALLSTGAMFAPAGTAMIASLARARNLSVIVACEGYKFSEKMQVDSIVYNELGSVAEIAIPGTDANGAPAIVPQRVLRYRGAAGAVPNQVSKTEEPDADAASLPFQVINLRYDVTPIGNISVVATDSGLLPPTSIPVFLREFRADSTGNSSFD